MERIFLTGGNGYIGSHLIKALVAKGYEVRAIVRSKEAHQIVQAAGAESVAGGLTSPIRLAKLMEGYHIVIHCAGMNGWDLPRSEHEKLRNSNTQTTKAVAEAAKRAGIHRFVLVSSAAVTQFIRDSSSGQDKVITAYGRSKWKGELELKYHHGYDRIFVRPVSTQGERLTGTAKLLLKMAKGELPFFVDTTLHVVNIHDCVRGIILATERGADGKIYTLNGAQLTTEQIYQALERATGIDDIKRAILLPPWIARCIGFAQTIAYNLFRAAPSTGIERVNAMLADNSDFVDGTADELGWKPTPVDEWLAEAVSYYRRQGLL